MAPLIDFIANRRFQKAEALYQSGQYDRAVPLFEALANEGHAGAQAALGTCYFHGRGVPHDANQAHALYRAAMEHKGNNAHVMFHDLIGWMGKNTEGRLRMVMDFFNHKKFDRAVPLLELLAHEGHIEAQYSLGCCFYGGEGVERDYAKAVEWWLKAARQGYAEAQYNLGCCFYNGRGVESDFGDAVEWWFKAAVQGIADAQDALGDCYYEGEGVKQDFAQAAKWFRIAAGQGHAEAGTKYQKLAEYL